ncbi:MAG: hypothetical protein R3E12_04185 [Candidatus Eisenbacteria bacterium]
MVRRILTLVGLLCLSSPTFAATVNTFVDTPLPDFVKNPGGRLHARCWVDRGTTTPDFLRVKITNPNGVVVYQRDLAGAVDYNLYWTVPSGSAEGIYHYEASYYSVENGLEDDGIDGFLVAGSTRGICAFKFIDQNGNGTRDPGEPLVSGWEICFHYPDGSVRCETTGEDGAACIFFLPSGTYTVCETMQDGYINTLPICSDVVVTTSIASVLFGNRVFVPGACCLPGGACVELERADCDAAGGVYQGDHTTCAETQCVRPGACCLPGGACEELLQTECETAGGIYQGDGTLCADAQCPRPGACCLPDGGCNVVSGAVCDRLGGIYHGDGTNCDEVDCNPVPTIESTWGRLKSRYR